MQASNVLGNFPGHGQQPTPPGNTYTLTSNGVPVILSLGGVQTLQMSGD